MTLRQFLLLCFLVAAFKAPTLRADLVDEDEPAPSKKPHPSADPFTKDKEEDEAKKEQTEQAAPKKEENPKKDSKKKSGTQQTQENEPVKFSSKGLRGARNEGTVYLEDDVVVTQADMRMESNQAVIFFSPTSNEVRQVNATGKVRFYKIDVETGQKIRAESREAIFYNQDQKVVLKGEPRLWRGDDLMTGNQISYDLKSGWIKADKVQGVVQPTKNEKSGTKKPKN